MWLIKTDIAFSSYVTRMSHLNEPHSRKEISFGDGFFYPKQSQRELSSAMTTRMATVRRGAIPELNLYDELTA